MGTVAFDTHKVVKDLKRTGFNDEQAEAVVSAVGEAVGETVATKADLDPLATKADLYRALWIQTGAILAAVAAILRLFR